MSRLLHRLLLLAGILGGCNRAHATPALDPAVAQLIVAIAADWQAPRGTLQCFERDASGPWRAASPVVPVLFGTYGLAWGRGVLGRDEPGRRKREGDGRAPAGVFALGTIFGNEPALPAGARFPYLQVTARDAWVDDPALPEYNRHIRLPMGAVEPPWFASQRMRLDDPAFRWRVEIRHNADAPEPGAGSAIFFHVQRGPDRKTAGCTTMPEPDLVSMIRWLREEHRPHYVLLPWADYVRLAYRWGLPPVELAQNLAPPSPGSASQSR